MADDRPAQVQCAIMNPKPPFKWNQGKNGNTVVTIIRGKHTGKKGVVQKYGFDVENHMVYLIKLTNGNAQVVVLSSVTSIFHAAGDIVDSSAAAALPAADNQPDKTGVVAPSHAAEELQPPSKHVADTTEFEASASAEKASDAPSSAGVETAAPLDAAALTIAAGDAAALTIAAGDVHGGVWWCMVVYGGVSLC
jgi:hypothetical protein